MQKIILMSILFGTFALPILLAKAKNPERGLRQVQRRFLVFCILYVLANLYVAPRL
jgi:hypothetical protein